MPPSGKGIHFATRSKEERKIQNVCRSKSAWSSSGKGPGAGAGVGADEANQAEVVVVGRAPGAGLPAGSGSAGAGKTAGAGEATCGGSAGAAAACSAFRRGSARGIAHAGVCAPS
eukprot:14379911-Alexandrium_andersonii.AAC.1